MAYGWGVSFLFVVDVRALVMVVQVPSTFYFAYTNTVNQELLLDSLSKLVVSNISTIEIIIIYS